MQRTLLTLCLALPLLATPALAQPPVKGTTHTFIDPVFTGTVFCDTFEEVHAIATADEPVEVFQAYFTKPNAQNEPTCAALMTTAIVLDVRPLGVMERDDKRFNAWAVQARIGNFTGFALYLEARADIVV
jgi:hypothetical protein